MKQITAVELAMILGQLQMTQTDFARALRVNPVTVNRWMNEKVPVPGYVLSWLEAAHPETLK